MSLINQKPNPVAETEAAQPRPRLDLGLADLAAGVDLVLCDVWGVVHDGVAHDRDAVDALRRFRAGGGTVVLLTNAPATKHQIVRRLDALDVPRDAYDEIASSGDVAVAMIVAAGCPKLLHIGPEGEHDLYSEAGRLGPRPARLVDADEADLAVCIGFDDRRERPDEYDQLLRALASRRIDLICANPDLVVHVGDDLVPCAGAIAERYELLGGVVTQAGKPFPPVYERAIALATAIRGDISRERMLAIGDALATDIRGAQAQGIAALFITGGIHRDQLHGAAGEKAAPDPDALEMLLRQTEDRPLAAMSSLSWDRR